MYELLLPTARPPVQRRPLSARATLVSGNVSSEIELHDISTQGLKLATDLDLAIDSQVEVRLPDESVVEANVRWMRDGYAGLRFTADLSEAQVTGMAAG